MKRHVIFCFRSHLMEKDPQTGQPVTSVEYSDRYFQDGSLRGDVPVVTLRNRWGVNFILVSQVTSDILFSLFFILSSRR